MPDNIAKWFNRVIADLFGDGAQTALARFMAAAGDRREHTTILRGINNVANERAAIHPEMIVLLNVLSDLESVPNMIREARKEPPTPSFHLLPAPKNSAAPPPRRKG